MQANEYQLVIQWSGAALIDYDSLIAVELELSDALPRSDDVDGHDMGCGEANIFIPTREPRRTFERASAVLERLGLIGTAHVAFHPALGTP